ncbi:MAG: hypothetical protein Q9160_001801 [Pyrenula sp. 1 TL-2023]
MSKPKALLKQGKQKRKSSQQSPETADEYLSVGVDLEEAGEKWRAGDAAKSMRFFLKAINTYNEGLSRFPLSIDLAYNKARLQYESVTHPLLVSQLQVPIIDALGTALESHRIALRLDQNNTDALFNTGELLTEIAERIAEDEKHADSNALPLLEEAIQLLQRCLELQQSQFMQFKNDVDIAMNDQIDKPPQPSTSLQSGGSDGDVEEQWVSVVEPVTEDSLVDTILAQIGTFTTFCNILSNGDTLDQESLQWVDESSIELMNKLQAYQRGSNPGEIALRIIQFRSAFLEASFRGGFVDAETYRAELSTTFKTVDMSSYSGLMAHTECLVSFVSNLNDKVHQQESIPPGTIWEALSTAMASLTKASQMPDSPQSDLTTTHSKRGDISLMQFQLGKPPVSFTTAIRNAEMLLKNASTYYRNASNLATGGEKGRGIAKPVILAALRGDSFDGNVPPAPILEDLILEMMNEQLLDYQDVRLIRSRLGFDSVNPINM